jgi:hypothetical protein|tara:strand:+ start:911 stop:1246 length:336 start_codon:yes stop_codon:yes gene_type:complete
MGKTKDLLYDGPFDDWKPDLNDMPDDAWFFNPDLRYDLEYEEWENSEGYVTFVNEEIDMLKKKYSDGEVVDALQYASKSIIIEPSEVGKEVYEKLFSEKVVEYLNKLNGTN